MAAASQNSQTPTSILNEAPSSGCLDDPNFATICSFLEKFGETCSIESLPFAELQEWIENTSEVALPLVQLHIRLLRRVFKSIVPDKWERSLAKFGHTYCNQDGWEIERFGYKKSKIQTKLRLLKNLLEAQFDFNAKFKSEVNKIPAGDLRLAPIGRDTEGQVYWYQVDADANLRVYREDVDDETWEVVASSQEEMISLISQLQRGEVKKPPTADDEVIAEEDSNGKDISPKEILLDTGKVEEDIESMEEDEEEPDWKEEEDSLDDDGMEIDEDYVPPDQNIVETFFPVPNSKSEYPPYNLPSTNAVYPVKVKDEKADKIKHVLEGIDNMNNDLKDITPLQKFEENVEPIKPNPQCKISEDTAIPFENSSTINTYKQEVNANSQTKLLPMNSDLEIKNETINVNAPVNPREHSVSQTIESVHRIAPEVVPALSVREDNAIVVKGLEEHTEKTLSKKIKQSANSEANNSLSLPVQKHSDRSVPESEVNDPLILNLSEKPDHQSSHISSCIHIPEIKSSPVLPVKSHVMSSTVHSIQSLIQTPFEKQCQDYSSFTPSASAKVITNSELLSDNITYSSAVYAEYKPDTISLEIDKDRCVRESKQGREDIHSKQDSKIGEPKQHPPIEAKQFQAIESNQNPKIKSTLSTSVHSKQTAAVIESKRILINESRLISAVTECEIRVAETKKDTTVAEPTVTTPTVTDIKNDAPKLTIPMAIEPNVMEPKLTYPAVHPSKEERTVAKAKEIVPVVTEIIKDAHKPTAPTTVEPNVTESKLITPVVVESKEEPTATEPKLTTPAVTLSKKEPTVVEGKLTSHEILIPKVTTSIVAEHKVATPAVAESKEEPTVAEHKLASTRVTEIKKDAMFTESKLTTTAVIETKKDAKLTAPVVTKSKKEPAVSESNLTTAESKEEPKVAVVAFPEIPAPTVTTSTVAETKEEPTVAAGKVTSVEIPAPKVTTPTVAKPKVTTPTVTKTKVTTPTITESKVTTPTVTKPKVTTSTVTESKVTTPTVTKPKVTTSTVTESKVTTPTVTKPKVTTSTVTAPKETTSTVTKPKVTTSAVTAPKETTSTVTSLKETTPTVTAPKETTRTVTQPKVTTPTATEPKVTTPTVTAPKVTTPTATEPKVTTPTVTAPKETTSTVIAPKGNTPTITAPKVRTPAVTGSKLTTSTVTESKEEPKVTGGKVTSLEAPAPKVTTPTVTAPKETTSTVTALKETTPTVTAPKETTPTVTAPKETTRTVTEPKVTTPTATAPKVITPTTTERKVTTPTVTAPKETISTVTAPKGNTPTITAPKVTTPAVTGSKLTTSTVTESKEEPKVTGGKVTSLEAPAPKVTTPAVTAPKVVTSTVAESKEERVVAEHKVAMPPKVAESKEKPTTAEPKLTTPTSTVPKIKKDAMVAESKEEPTIAECKDKQTVDSKQPLTLPQCTQDPKVVVPKETTPVVPNSIQKIIAELRQPRPSTESQPSRITSENKQVKESEYLHVRFKNADTKQNVVGADLAGKAEVLVSTDLKNNVDLDLKKDLSVSSTISEQSASITNCPQDLIRGDIKPHESRTDVKQHSDSVNLKQLSSSTHLTSANPPHSGDLKLKGELFQEHSDLKSRRESIVSKQENISDDSKQDLIISSACVKQSASISDLKVDSNPKLSALVGYEYSSSEEEADDKILHAHKKLDSVSSDSLLKRKAEDHLESLSKIPKIDRETDQSGVPFNPIVGDAIEEDMITITGEGAGVENEGGNEEESFESVAPEEDEGEEEESTELEVKVPKGRGRPKKKVGAPSRGRPATGGSGRGGARTNSAGNSRGRKREIENLGISFEGVSEMNGGDLINDRPVRASRRIAQIRQKEEEERRKLEEEKLAQLKAAQIRKQQKLIEREKMKAERDTADDGKPKIKKLQSKKQNKEYLPSPSESESDDEAEDGDDYETKPTKMKKKRKRNKNGKAKGRGGNPWGTDSSSEEDEAVEEEEEYHYEEEEEELIFNKSDHEFSPESDLGDDEDASPSRHARTAKRGEEAFDKYAETACDKCGKGDHPEWILLCDMCDKGFHASCVRPQLWVIPEGQWFCPPCQHNTLIDKLKLNLIEYEKILKKRENEVLRKQRLAYVGISLDNVLPGGGAAPVLEREDKENYEEPENTKERKRRRRRIDSDDEDDELLGDNFIDDRSDGNSHFNSSDDESDEPMYKLRARRATKSFNFKEYDDMINSALRVDDDLEGIETPEEIKKPEPSNGKGKCMGDDDESEERESDSDAKVGENGEVSKVRKRLLMANKRSSSDEPSGKKLPDDSEEDEELDEKEKNRRNELLKHSQRKTKRRLNDLDALSDEDEDSDEDFKGSGGDDDDEDEEEAVEDDSEWSGDRDADESDDSIQRGARNKKQGRLGRREKYLEVGTVRRSTRRRKARISYDESDQDEEEEGSDKWNSGESDESESNSESDDETWGKKKKKKVFNPPKSRFFDGPAFLKKPKVAPKKKKRKVDDDDVDRPWNKHSSKVKKDVEAPVERRTRGRLINFKDILDSGESDDDGNIRPKRRRILSDSDDDSDAPTSSSRLIAEIKAQNAREAAMHEAKSILSVEKKQLEKDQAAAAASAVVIPEQKTTPQKRISSSRLSSDASLSPNCRSRSRSPSEKSATQAEMEMAMGKPVPAPPIPPSLAKALARKSSSNLSAFSQSIDNNINLLPPLGQPLPPHPPSLSPSPTHPHQIPHSRSNSPSSLSLSIPLTVPSSQTTPPPPPSRGSRKNKSLKVPNPPKGALSIPPAALTPPMPSMTPPQQQQAHSQGMRPNLPADIARLGNPGIYPPNSPMRSFHPAWRGSVPPPYGNPNAGIPPSSIGKPPPLNSTPFMPQQVPTSRPGYPSPPPLRIPNPSSSPLQAFQHFKRDALPPGMPMYRMSPPHQQGGGPLSGILPPNMAALNQGPPDRYFGVPVPGGSPYAHSPYGLPPPHNQSQAQSMFPPFDYRIQHLQRPSEPFKEEPPAASQPSGNSSPPPSAPHPTKEDPPPSQGDGEFGGLVSYFSSQRSNEEDLDT